jgi:DNA-directed RNA polymerase specialized sigma24 family protein
MAVPDWPVPDAAADLYARLTAGDRVASADLAAAFLVPLVEYLRAAFPRVDDHVRVTAAEDALLSLFRDPTVFDPARGGLATFLRMAARGDLSNALRKERKHQIRRAEQDCVELAAADGNTSRDDEDQPSFDDPDLAAVIAALSDDERRLFDLMRDGEKRTPVLAEALGVADRPFAEQQHEVWRVRERIMRRFKRAKGGP